jgi:hypothetical protein
MPNSTWTKRVMQHIVFSPYCKTREGEICRKNKSHNSRTNKRAISESLQGVAGEQSECDGESMSPTRKRERLNQNNLCRKITGQTALAI